MMKRMITANKTARAITVIGYCLLVIVLASCSGDGSEMRAQLEELERQNRADSVMTNDSLAEQLVKYFDRHGTPNERMRAHYILGRTYADMGEAPAALEAYLEAADCADTTQADCDYAKLSRVYAQSSRIYYDLIQPRSQIKELEMASYYAWKAKDTLIAIESYAQKANAYSLMHRPDSVVFIRENASHLYESAGQYRRAATTIGASITSALDLGDISRARHFIDKYECASGLFDSLGTIVKGREMYYYAKGRYHLATFKVDSAEYHFRRLQKEGNTLNHQIAACKGLQEVYEKLKIPDSIAKYANLGYQLNDSAYSLSEMENIQRLKASYNYNRNKLLAEQKTSEAREAWFVLFLIIALMMITALTVAVLFSNYKKRKQLELLQYQNDLDNLGKAQEELMELRSEEKKELEGIIQKKDQQLVKLQQIVAQHRKEIDQDAQEERLASAPVIKRFHEYLEDNPPKAATANDLKELRNLINETIPSFYGHFQMLRFPEYNICMLIRARFSPSQVCKLMGISETYISNLRKRILFKAYAIQGSAKDLDERILAIH
jgi:hypothetical protein